MTEILDLSFRDLQTLPEEALLGHRNLTGLNLRGNRLRTLPEVLANVRSLRYLNLACNALDVVPAVIASLRELEVLILDENQIRTLPRGLFRLHALKILSIASNELQEIPRDIALMSRLVDLDLWGNGLTEMPPLSGLRALKYIDIGANGLRALPAGLVQCRQLVRLQAISNSIEQLPLDLGEIASLASLNLSGNRISRLPPSLGRAPKLSKILVRDNPIESPPPQVCMQGCAAIKTYLQGIDAPASTTIVHEAKLILVGDPDVGKTALVERLSSDIFRDVRIATDGISVGKWTLPSPDGAASTAVNVWDFGGQEIYHSTHRYFLSANAVYLVVLDPTLNDVAGRLDYWLHTIYSVDPKGCILIVSNKLDQGPIDLDFKSLRQRFSTVAGHFQVSCLHPQMRGSEFERLRSEIAAHCWERSSAEWPNAWLLIRDDLTSSRKPYLAYAEYLDICKRHGVDAAGGRVLSGLLHRLGSVLHFPDDEWLSHFLIIEPEWATSPVYSLLCSDEARALAGRLPEQLLQQLIARWVEGDITGQQIVAALMRKFGLMYRLVDSSDCIIPELLSEQPCTELDEQVEPWVSLQYTYRFMPPSLVPQLIIRAHDHIVCADDGRPLHWRHGLVVTSGDAVGMVVEDCAQKRLHVLAMKSGAPALRNLLKTWIEAVNSRHAGIGASVGVPCRCEAGCQHLFLLRDVDAVGSDLLLCSLSRKKVSGHLLMTGVDEQLSHEMRVAGNSVVNNFIVGSVMGDQFNAGGNMNAIGSQASIRQSVVQSDSSTLTASDSEFQSELRKLIEVSRKEGLSPIVVEVIEDALSKADRGERGEAESILRKLGRETYDVSKRAVLPVLTAFLKQTLGL